MTLALFAVTLPPAVLAAWIVGRLAGEVWQSAVLAAALLASGSVMAHEWGHLYALRRTGGREAVAGVSVSRSWTSASIRRPRLGVARERWVAAAGPIAGASCGLPLLALPLPGTVRALLLVPCALHLLSLMPWLRDGANFWRAHA